MPCVRVNKVLDSEDPDSTASYQTLCAKEETSLEATELVGKVSTVINLMMKRSQCLIRSQVNVALIPRSELLLHV